MPPEPVAVAAVPEATPAAESTVPTSKPHVEGIAATEMVEVPTESIAAAATTTEPVESVAATEVAPMKEAAPAQEGEPAKEAEPVKWEEIWRPRRRGRAVEAAERDKRAKAEPGEATRPHHRPRQSGYQARPEKTGGGDKRRDRREPRRDSGKPPKPRREERPRVALQASPPGRKGGFDPDSPFAALSALKATMDKRTQE
jgi:ATP-dependent RNA helicase SUPV3L1/SUV3